MYIAERCNQSCVFCLEEDGTWNEFVDPSTQQVYDTLQDLRRKGADHLTFMGGETFFRKDLSRILGEAKKVGFTRLGVTTNGTVLSKPGFVKDLVEAGLDFIEFSVHGHTPELANSIGGTSFTFERQAEALAEIDSLGDVHTIVNVVICRENKGELVSIARYLRERFPRIPVRFKFKFVSMTGLALERASGQAVLRHDEVDFLSVGDYLTAESVPFWYYNVPLCYLGRHAAHSHELGTLAGDETYFDFDHRGKSEYYDSTEQLEGRVYPAESCADCRVAALCPGIEESYRLSAGADGLASRDDDPLELLAAALPDRAADASTAEARLRVLERRPRPSRFLRVRPEGALRFRSDAAPEPFDVQVEAKREGTPSFASTKSFAVSYRRWSDLDPTSRDDVRALLDAVLAAVRDADEQSLDLDSARAAASAVTAGGFRAEKAPEPGAPRKKRVALPMLLREEDRIT